MTLMTDDLTTLRECWSEVEPPSPGAQDRARAALMARVSETRATKTPVPAAPHQAKARRWRPPTWAWRSGIVGVGVAALAVGVVAVGGNGHRANGPVAQPVPTTTRSEPTRTPPPASPVARIFELAAAHAAAQPFTPPRPDQWIYIELKQSLAGHIAGTKGQEPEKLVQYWKRADGRKTANIENGVLTVVDNQIGSEMPPLDYPTLASLPTDPHALLAWLQSEKGPDGDSRSFSIIASIVGQNVLPPDVAAAALRAAALIPGVAETAEPTTIDGHSVIALGRVMDGWRQFDILLDSDTHAVIGYRDIAATDYKDPQGAYEFKKGELVDMVLRMAAVIVDAPGKTS
jgi:hypothetical protein